MPDASNTNRAKLIGKWFGRVSGEAVGLEFLEDGRLAYAILTENSTQIMRMTYRVDGAVLVTDQPSHPREERTRFGGTSPAPLCLSLAASRAVSRGNPAKTWASSQTRRCPSRDWCACPKQSRPTLCSGRGQTMLRLSVPEREKEGARWPSRLTHDRNF